MPSVWASCACSAAASDGAPRERAEPGRDEAPREPPEPGRDVLAEFGRLLLCDVAERTDLADVADDGRADGAEPGRATRSAWFPSECSFGWLRPMRCIHAGVNLFTGAELGRSLPAGALRTGADAGRPATTLGRIGGRLSEAPAISQRAEHQLRVPYPSRYHEMRRHATLARASPWK